MIKMLDYIVLAVLVIGLVVLCFFQKCSLDIYFLVFGFAIAAMSAVTLLVQKRNEKNYVKHKTTV